MLSHTRLRQRTESFMILNARLGPCLQQRLNEGRVGFFDGKMQRRLARPVLQIRLGMLTKQPLHPIELFILAGFVQSRFAKMILGIDVQPLRQ